MAIMAIATSLMMFFIVVCSFFEKSVRPKPRSDAGRGVNRPEVLEVNVRL